MNMAEISLVFVDDEVILADLISDYIKSEHPKWKLKCFSDGIKALDYIRMNGNRIDVVVCDIGMPYVSGIEILEIVRRNHQNIRRVILSGKIDSQSILGSNKFAEVSLCKPIKSAELCAKIIELIEG